MAEPIKEPIEKYGLSKRKAKSTLFSRIGVVGAGKEGSVIATTAALNGIEVVFLEPTEEKIVNANTRIEEKLNKKIENWGLTQNEKRAVMGRITGTSDYEDFKGCDFVIEAIRYDDQTGVREVTQRKEVFYRLEEVLDPTAIIASNISTVVVTDLASELKHKERCIGLHFLSNVPGSQIIEIVRSLYTSDETFDKVCQFAKLINHQFVSVKESAGLVSLRLFLIQLNEACGILMEGISNVEDIDRVLTVGFGHHQGVFRTADQMGVEKIVSLLNNMHEEYGHLKYKPSPILLRLFRAKHFGISRGIGFYTYDEKGNIIKGNL
ncbi:3-hydroxyacyl-CoA dehydrogenase family protein [Paludibacter sp. 221]|uniref:3-hydroxyacyl-CoA dehydrogenase family protein n=1 Tax=Paludibacter sp. 221 TaxID=2302939 RepID=UPI0013D6B696|nr:3-hydroxyacyl-CoA dehydrogenase family protein [Paludibacter sp. 221]NDV46597.1 3-hydroxyacyl-CoA dehydrogenase family protein [Paludibacter sp. 221]